MGGPGHLKLPSTITVHHPLLPSENNLGLEVSVSWIRVLPFFRFSSLPFKP